MDVVSVTSDPDGLFSHDRGILVLGGGSPAYPHNGANFFQDWERYAHVELLPKNGPGGEDPGFSADCGLKVFGGMSRIYEKKSLALNFRDCYGASSLDYPVFDSRDFGEYDNLILRTSGQDRLLTVMKDAMFTSVLDDAGVGFVQAYRPVVSNTAEGRTGIITASAISGNGSMPIMSPPTAVCRPTPWISSRGTGPSMRAATRRIWSCSTSSKPTTWPIPAIIGMSPNG